MMSANHIKINQPNLVLLGNIAKVPGYFNDISSSSLCLSL